MANTFLKTNICPKCSKHKDRKCRWCPKCKSISPAFKVCCLCKRIKKLQDFDSRKVKKLNVVKTVKIEKCKACMKKHIKSKKVSDQIQKSILTKRGLDFYEVENYRKNHSGNCEICGHKPKEEERNLAVDHCHINGNFRGLLCVTCNLGLGYFKDNLKLLDKAKEYLTKTKT